MKRAGEDGFALVTALFFMALLALIVVVIEGWIVASVDRATSLRDRVADRAAAISALDRVGFALVNGQVGPRGYELSLEQPNTGTRTQFGINGEAPQGPFIAVDGRPYSVGAALIRVQDGSGLYDIGKAGRDTLDKLFKNYGLGEREGAALAAALFDYVGKPNDVSGLRDADYEAVGLPPPRHAPLLSPWEPLRVLRWGEASALWRGPEPLGDMLTLGPVGSLNANTAPARVLVALAGMDEREAARFVATRAQPRTNLRDVQAMTGAANTEEVEDRPLSLTPSNIMRLSVTEPGDPLRHVIGVRLTPLGPSPFRIDYAIDLPQTAGLANPGTPEPLPALPPSAPTVQ